MIRFSWRRTADDNSDDDDDDNDDDGDDEAADARLMNRLEDVSMETNDSIPLLKEMVANDIP